MTEEAGTVQVALLRGINVGGRTTVPMAQLRETVESTGASDVATYIQSGNVVLTCPLTEGELRPLLERAVAERFDVSPTVMVRTAEEMAAVVEHTPYPDAAEKTVHVAFLHQPPDDAARDRLGAIETGEETFVVLGREVYLHLPNGLGRSTLADAVIRRIEQPATVRNWRTVCKLAEMSTP